MTDMEVQINQFRKALESGFIDRTTYENALKGFGTQIKDSQVGVVGDRHTIHGGINFYGSKEDPEGLLRRYLTDLTAETNRLPWGRIALPTEAQWEMAARGTDGRIYPWGDKPDPSRANYEDTDIHSTSPMGCFPGGKSPHGILDISGNTWEWCRDWYDGEYYRRSPATDPEGPSTGSARVVRGGGWFKPVVLCWVAAPDGFGPGGRGGDLGFRLVRLPSQPE